MEDGGFTSIYLKHRLSWAERRLIFEYEQYLTNLGVGYSFMHEFHGPASFPKYQARQIIKAIGCIPQQELVLGGIATPMFRAVEALMKYFDGYYTQSIESEDERNALNDRCYAIRKRNKFLIPVYTYHLVDWQFMADYFNQLTTDPIRNIYDIERFKQNEFERL